jgi:ERCC4-type nuclease
VLTNGQTEDFALPGLRSLGDLHGAQPVIYVDTREVKPLQFRHLSVIRQTLGEGDYQICGISDWSVERKASLDELVGCCVGKKRERFERELQRLRPYAFKRLLVVGATCDDDVLNYQYFSEIAPRAVLGSLDAWQAAFDLPFILVPTPQEAALTIERLAFYWCRRKEKEMNELTKGCGRLEFVSA